MDRVLIVPYGIETIMLLLVLLQLVVLIVPYGIETLICDLLGLTIVC